MPANRAKRREDMGRFVVQHNAKMRETVLGKLKPVGINAAMRDLHKQVGINAIDRMVKSRTAARQTVAYDELYATATAAMARWVKQRRALERALDGGRLIFLNMGFTIFTSPSGRVIRVFFMGSAVIAYNWQETSRLRYSVVVRPEEFIILSTDTVRRWIMHFAHYSNTLKLYYVPNECVVWFISELRVQLRSVRQANLPFTLTPMVECV